MVRRTIRQNAVVLIVIAVALGTMLASCAIPGFGLPPDTQSNVFSNISNGLSQ
jgi:hypothetical protein